MRLNQGLLTCHGDYDPEDEFCKTECPKLMREECLMRTKSVWTFPESVALALQRRREAHVRMDRWLKRTDFYVKSYAVGFSPSMRFKRAIKFGQLRRGLVLRKWRNKNDDNLS